MLPDSEPGKQEYWLLFWTQKSAFGMALGRGDNLGNKAGSPGMERGKCGLVATMLTACLPVPVQSPLGLLKRSIPQFYFSIFFLLW